MHKAFLLFFVAFVVPARAESLNVEKINHYLRAQKEIRIYVGDTLNYGHQKSSLNVMRSLRVLGFEGVFEVLVYDRSTTKYNVRKIENLLPGIRFDGTIVDLPDFGSVIGRPVGPESPRLPLVNLAITGGYDGDPTSAVNRVQARTFICLQPLNWELPNFLVHDLQIHYLWSLKAMGIPTHPRSTEDFAELFLTQLRIRPEWEAKLEGMLTLYKQLRRVEFAPAYGLHMSPNQTHSLLTYVKGIRTLSLSKPVVIPMLSERVSLVELESFGVQRMDIRDPQLQSKLNGLGAGDFLVVDVGFLPPDVFSYVFKNQTLPGLIEGKNTISLMQELGLPYIQLLGSLAELERITAQTISTAGVALPIIHSAYRIFDSKESDWTKPLSSHQRSDMARFFSSVSADSGVVREFFRSFQGLRARPDENKVAQALHTLLTIVEQSPTIPANDCGADLGSSHSR